MNTINYTRLFVAGSLNNKILFFKIKDLDPEDPHMIVCSNISGSAELFQLVT